MGKKSMIPQLDEFKKNAQQIKKSYENFKIRSILKFFAKKRKLSS